MKSVEKNNAVEEEFMRIGEAAEYLRLSINQFNRIRKEYNAPTHYLGSTPRFLKSELRQ